MPQRILPAVAHVVLVVAGVAEVVLLIAVGAAGFAVVGALV